MYPYARQHPLLPPEVARCSSCAALCRSGSARAIGASKRAIRKEEMLKLKQVSGGAGLCARHGGLSLGAWPGAAVCATRSKVGALPSLNGVPIHDALFRCRCAAVAAGGAGSKPDQPPTQGEVAKWPLPAGASSRDGGNMATRDEYTHMQAHGGRGGGAGARRLSEASAPVSSAHPGDPARLMNSCHLPLMHASCLRAGASRG